MPGLGSAPAVREGAAGRPGTGPPGARSPATIGGRASGCGAVMAAGAELTDTGGMELLERGASLASLAEYAAQARRGEGRLVLLGGEAGVGKSALVEQLQRDLPDARWSWSACDGLFTPRPLGPLHDLADQLGGDLLDLCVAGAVREELFRALLRQVSAPGTLSVVVVEDVHWADEATIDLLRFAGRRPPAPRGGGAAHRHLPGR